VKIKIIYKKLGREQAHGIAESDGIIYLDPRLKGKKHLEICLHELSHLLNPNDDEETIIRKSVTLTKVLWKEGYRRVDDSNDEPLQDGSI
jgi:hypothetical protein